MLGELRQRFPDAAEIGQLSTEYEHARERLQAEDLAQTRRKVAELVGVNAYQRAEEVAGALVHRHPMLPEAGAMLARIRRDRQAYLQQESKRQFAELDRLTAAKDWQRALALAEKFLSAFPDSKEVDLVRDRLPVLRSNAEIGDRQRLEAELKEAVRTRQYAQALQIAQFIVATYPHSPQAEALREQLPRFRQRAAGPHSG
jgi:hypothetical protein